MIYSDKIKFYLIIFFELISFPFYFLYQIFNHYLIKIKNTHVKYRSPIVDFTNVYFHVHEWGGYPNIRQKKLKNSKSFFCGLNGYLSKIKEYSGEKSLHSVITMSNVELYPNKDYLAKSVDKFIEVKNNGMDFSGYSAMYNYVKNKPNAFIIISNSSVNLANIDFIDSYISYMNDNPDVGIIGISYNTRCNQSLIRNKFRPHIQSFFYFTTISVLDEIVAVNNGIFPGSLALDKRLIIRDGEIKISELAMFLGYKLAIVCENGSVFTFDSNASYKNWSIPHGDMRYSVDCPNVINYIK